MSGEDWNSWAQETRHEPCAICEARAAERVRREEVEPLRDALQHAVTQLEDRYWPDRELHESWEDTMIRAREALAKVKP